MASGSSSEPLPRWFRRIVDEITNDVTSAVTTAVEGGAESMRQTIRTSGRPTSSGPGRIDSGDMLANVKSKVEADKQSVTGEFGWLDDREMYYFYQDQGFEHWISHEKIPGMFALDQAYEEAKIQFESKLRKR